MTFLALSHMCHATQVMGRVGWVGGDDDVSITSTHVTCYKKKQARNQAPRTVVLFGEWNSTGTGMEHNWSTTP